jgi:putative flippase GtrA
MVPRPLSAPARFWSRYGRKLQRYLGVSMVNVCVGQTLLVVLHGIFDWPGMAANAVAVVAGSIPSYLLNRHYVWEQDRGGHRVGREILPFWALALAGLVLSTLLVGGIGLVTDRTIGVQAANAVAFAALWVVRFVVLDRLLWREGEDDELLDVAA